MTASVLLPSYRRPKALARCLSSLAAQTVLPDEVLVVWQGDDSETRVAAEGLQRNSPYPLRILHNRERGVVPAENAALREARGEIVLMIDDDAVAPRQWVERHLAHYNDAAVGAVGGPADNFRPDGSPFVRRSAEPVGKLRWYGRFAGNMYDHPQSWRRRPPRGVDHLVGYNLSFRRVALAGFEDRLLPYWQMFEADACLTVKARGYRVLFDFGNVVEHWPTNTAYEGGRSGDLAIKVFHLAYNEAFILAKHSARSVRAARLAYLLAAGSVSAPGLLASAFAVARFGDAPREARVLANTLRARVAGWRAGASARRGRAHSAEHVYASCVLQ